MKMPNKDGLLLWLLAGAGVVLIYSAYKNVQPQELLGDYLSGSKSEKKKISSYAPSVIPNITTEDGKTYDTAPGGKDGYITTDPPVPGVPSNPNNPLALYYDANGNPVGVVPPIYQKAPSMFISGV